MHPGCLIPALSHYLHSSPSRYSQPSCPAMPTAQTDGQSLGPAGRAIPTARSGIRVASLYWEVKDGCGQLCEATRVGTPSPAARPCRRHRPTGSRWVRPAGMSDGHPDRPIVYPSLQSLLGSERWMWTVV